MITGRLDGIAKRHQKLQELMSNPETLSNKKLYAQYVKEFSSISRLVNKYTAYKTLLKDLEKVQEMLNSQEHKNESEFLELADEERKELSEKIKEQKHELEELLLEEDVGEHHKNIIMEIRAGTGGEEAALFVADLYRMYTRYGARLGWKIELMSSRTTAIGGFKEICFSVAGEDAFKKLQYESGVHRVQRVPATETSGRIHTSAVSVAVLAEPEEVELNLDAGDLKVDVYRASGHGGQSVNTTDSAVRITHLPTGTVVCCQDERSQIKNKVKAMRVLRARILDKLQTEEKDKIRQQRKSQVGSGDRSEKIRTYNFPDGRVTDHRIKLTLHKIEAILEGNLDELIEGLLAEDKKRRLAQWKKE